MKTPFNLNNESQLFLHQHPEASIDYPGFMSATDKTKLDGIATGATANATDAQLRDRATHTGTQEISTVTGLQTALDSKQATLVSGTNIKTINGTSILGPGDVVVDSIHVHASNKTGSTIPALAAVYINGVQGSIATIGLAQSNSITTANAIGITTASILNNATGTIISNGDLIGVDTSSFTEGALLWLSPTVPGGITSVKPSSPNIIVLLGTVTRSHATQGTVLVRIQITGALDGLYDVSVAAATSGQLLRKDSDGLWKGFTAPYITSNQTITYTGDATGSGTTAVTLTLANSGVTAGTYPKVTVDSKGRVTVGSALSASDIPNLDAAKITTGTFGAARLPAGTTSAAGIVQLSTATNSTSTTLAATPSAVKSAYDLAVAAIPSTEKGAANGVAPLGADSKISATYLPSYVDDVLEYADFAALPATGETGKIYVTIDNNKIFRWSGSVYIEISPTTGNSDTATKLATARTISATGDATWSVSFDGSANATAALTLADTGITANTYKSVTVNSKGLITAGTNPTTLAGYGITDAQPASATLDTFNTNIASATTGIFKKTAANTWSFTSLVAADIPNLDTGKLTTGTLPVARGGTGVATITGLIKGNGTSAFTAAVSGTDVKTVNGATLLGSGNVDVGGSVNGILKCNGAGVYSQAVAGTDYVAPSGSITGNAATATKLATARTISATGDATWSVSFDGSANATAALTLANSGVTANTYKSVTVDAKGRVTAGTNPTTLSGYGITDAQPLDATLTAIAGLANSANKMFYFTGTDTVALMDAPAFGRSLVGAATQSEANTLLGIQTNADLNLLSDIFTRATFDYDFVKANYKEYKNKYIAQLPLLDAITCVRGTTATVNHPFGTVTYDINEPRIEYNPATAQPLGVLAERTRTNLLLHSQYTGASGETPPTSWLMFSNTGVTTTAASPRFSGAIRATQSGTAKRECYVQTLTLPAGTTYTFSAYFAAGTSADNNVLRARPASGDTPTGTLVLPGSAVTSAGTYSVTFATVSGGSYEFYIGLGCSGDATGTVIHETPQLEAGSFPTSYIPTTTAQVTRAYDDITIPGIVSDLSKATEYTIFAEYTALAAEGVLFGIGDTFSDTFYCTSDTPFFVRSGGTGGPSAPTSAISAGVRYKHAIKIKSGDYAVYRNGTSLFTSSTVFSPPASIARVKLGSAPWEAVSGTSNQSSVIFHRFTIIPRALSNAEMQLITK